MKEESSLKDNKDILYENIREEKRNDFFCFVSDFDKTDRYHEPIIASHYHAYVEIIYIFSGELKVVINDFPLIGTAGDMFVILPSEVHSFERKKGCKYICIQVDPTFIFSGIMSTIELRFNLPFTNGLNANAHLFKSKSIDKTDIPKQIQAIIMEYENPSKLQRLAIRTSLSNVTLWVLRSWQNSAISPIILPKTNDKLLKLAPILEIISRDFTTELRAEDLARIAEMSTSYFSRFFNSAVGMGFTEYLTFVRITEAERLIVSTDMSIADVASRVGFSNPSYFITQFRKQFKFSPKQYRQQFYNKNSKDTKRKG